MDSNKYRIVKSLNDFDKMYEDLKDSELVSFDIETNDKEPITAKVIGIAATKSTEYGWYLVLREWDGTSLVNVFSESDELKIVNKLLKSLSTKKLIMHNGVFDVVCIAKNYEIDLTDALYADTMLMKHTIDENRPFGLKDIAVKFQSELGLPMEKEANEEQIELKKAVQDAGGKWLKKQKDMYMAPTPVMGKYAVKDVILTALLFEYLEDRLFEEKSEHFFYEREIMPLYRKGTIPMKLQGIYINVEHFKKLKKELECDILRLTDEVFELIDEDIQPRVEELLDKHINASKKGEFAFKVLTHYDIPVPLNKKTGRPTLAKSALQYLEENYPESEAVKWLTDETYELDRRVYYSIKKDMYLSKKPENPRIFNLGSKDDLAWLYFTKYGCTPKSYSRKTNKPQLNKDSMDDYDHLPCNKHIKAIRKTEKILSTYVEPILEKHIDGKLYPDMQQWGTTSGRYSCGGGLNLQTLPRFEMPNKCGYCDSKNIQIEHPNQITINVKCGDCGKDEDIFNALCIKEGFVAPKGYKVVNADFSALEPRIFSWVSNDFELKRVYLEGLDLYSKIAIDVFGLTGVSANEGDANYLKKVNPKARQESKVFTLAVPYGSSPGRIKDLMGKSFDEAKQIVNKYLDSYPELKRYMQTQEHQARIEGFVETRFGRKRHLDRARELFGRYGKDLYSKKKMKELLGEDMGVEIYYEFRGYMNNAKNFPIQASAAHVTNASLIRLADLFKEYKIDGWISLQVHDEITCYAREDQAELAAKLLKDAMENNYVTENIDIPMIADPMIGDNFAETK